MIQDIEPHRFINHYTYKEIQDQDLVCIVKGGTILVRTTNGPIVLPEKKELVGLIKEEAAFHYLFTVDNKDYYLAWEAEFEENSQWTYINVRDVPTTGRMYQILACAVASQLNRWFANNRFCGCCGNKMQVDQKERAFRCSSCGHIVYPYLAPSVIVGVIDREQDRILMTKYAGRDYKKYALIAGYAEIGESLEQTVSREVMEEAGLRVKNIRYYKSQPWPFTDTLLVGYFADLDGSSEVKLDEEELAEGTWFHRQDIPENPSDLSLTNEMIEKFRKGNQ